MSADAQSALSDEYSSAVKNMIRTNTHQPRFLQQRATSFEPASPLPTSASPKDTPSPEGLPTSYPHRSAAVAFNSPQVSNSLERRHPSVSAMSVAVVPPPSRSVTSAFQKLQGQVQGALADQITPLRLAGHLSVLGVAAIILLLSQVTIPDWDLALGALPNNALAAQAETPNQLGASGLLSTELQDSSGKLESLQRIALPFTTVPEEPARETISKHVVQAGETILGIAAQYGVQPETIIWANPEIERNPDRISIGDQLNILPVNGVLHAVRPGETLSAIASKYKVDIDAIVGYSSNALEDATAGLTVGQELIVPGGEKPLVAQQVVTFNGTVPASATKGSGAFAWPTSGSVSQGYWGGHAALDVSSWTGAPVKVADSGYVVYVGRGWSSGYGNHIIVDHGNGYTTLYAHLNSVFVGVGENLGKGQQIGTVGNTGNSTGPHLHFEIRYQGVRRNPYSFLP